MDLNLEFILKVLATFLLSGLTFFVMMKLQAKKQKEADQKFYRDLKIRGISSELNGGLNDSEDY